MQKTTTFLMFEGRAEEAMHFYTSVFQQAEIISITKYGPMEAGAEGSVKLGIFSIHGQEYMCIDSTIKHGFGFTAAMSIYVRCESGEEIESLFHSLSHGGSVLMPLGPYPFSKNFGWLTDKFGVSWQLNVE
jgi:predicted 3-demethylubiquinone-9 3-methyltransferase (glyoxalase superfamily)